MLSKNKAFCRFSMSVVMVSSPCEEEREEERLERERGRERKRERKRSEKREKKDKGVELMRYEVIFNACNFTYKLSILSLSFSYL